MATTYDIYLKGDCIAKIEKDIVSLTPSYKFFYEAENNGNPCYRATGSFSQRKYDIYARDGSEVATIGRQLLELMPDKGGHVPRQMRGRRRPGGDHCSGVGDRRGPRRERRGARRAAERGGDDGGGMFGFLRAARVRLTGFTYGNHARRAGSPAPAPRGDS